MLVLPLLPVHWQVMILSYLGPSAKCEWNLSATEESLLTSMVFLGMTLGAPGK